MMKINNYQFTSEEEISEQKVHDVKLETIEYSSVLAFMVNCILLQSVHSLSVTIGSKISPPSWWSEEFWGSQNITSLPPPNIIIDTLVFRFSKSKIADLKYHNLHETSKAAALIKNKGTDTTCFVLEVCKRQGNNVLCAICQVQQLYIVVLFRKLYRVCYVRCVSSVQVA